MPSSIADNVTASTLEITINGNLVQNTWLSYSVDSNLLTPADAWHVALGVPDGILPDGVNPGAPVTLKVDKQLVLTGLVDEVSDEVKPGRRTLELSGRDGAAVLLDCSAPIFTATQQTLDQIIAKIVRPLGVKNIRIDADAKLLRERVSTEPGDTAWSTLQRAAEANGLWPWFEPDGTLVVGGPDYAAEPIVKLIMDTEGNSNMLSLKLKRNVAERYSDVTVLGQAHSGMTAGVGKNNLKASAKDTGVLTYRPKVLCDHEAQTTEIARARARKFIADARVKGFDLVAEVPGHLVLPGKLWTPGKRVRLISEPHGFDQVVFLMGRTFQLDRVKGQTTKLLFKEDQVWVLDAHPHKRMHRRGKNSTPGRVVDLAGPQ